MLPDFPAQKEKLIDLWIFYLDQKRRNHLGFLADISSYHHHEGSRWVMEGDNSSNDESEYKRTESSFVVRYDEIPYLTPDKIAQKLDTVAKNMANQMEEQALKDLFRSMEANGRIVNGDGKPFSIDMFLKALESMSIDFDNNGNPILPTVLVSPELGEELKNRIEEWEKDSRFNRIIERKREEWRARESRRKLVD